MIGKTLSQGNRVGKDAIYITLPKCANTSIKERILEKTNNPRMTFRELRKEKNNKFIFTFVRNPYDRIMSLYKDKILNKNVGKNKIKKNKLDKLGKNIQEIPSLSFKDFVDLICIIPDKFSDYHFESMTSILNRNKVKCNFIGKVENINEDWRKISMLLNLTKNLSQRNKTQKEKKKYYTKELKEKVYQRYKEDFINFNYEK